ncbi:LysR family transcriptional regulator [Kitasatospora sp. NA04385]|uniref:LysR family transcriptional regulator n=1 Tax=Kitasatospora sp. NA04385 TaxID=2742135 RepID=UPI0034CDFDAE
MDDPDLRQLRAFVTVAEQRHFGRAAERLAISQQAASKRIAALERELGVRLLERGPAAVRLTEAGQQLLAPARAALAAGQAAVAAVRQRSAPARLDVWGHLYEPLRTVREVLAAAPGLTVEVGPARDLGAVAGALAWRERRRVRPPPAGRRAESAHRLVRLEPVDVVLPAGHPLARADRLRPPTWPRCGWCCPPTRPGWTSWPGSASASASRCCPARPTSAWPTCWNGSAPSPTAAPCCPPNSRSPSRPA